ncbi:MAG: hypothetical protein V4591_11800 [Bdellovibrionota bacterium]
MSIFTAAQRRSLERISGNYLNLTADESDFNVSDVFSLGILLTAETNKTNRVQKLIDYYKSAYSCVCNALKVHNPEIFLVRLANLKQGEPWDDFSDFKAVWYPKWFENQLSLRSSLFCFTNEEEQKIKPDFWGLTSSDENLKANMLAVRDSLGQIRVGALALVFKIDEALVSLLGFQVGQNTVSWKHLKEKFSFPVFL